MKKVVFSLLLFLFLAFGRSIAQTDLMKNVVFVDNEGKEGLGLVIGQENGVTYVLTPFHVVKAASTDESSNITVYSHDKAIRWEGAILPGRIDIAKDIVCLTIQSGSFHFNTIPVVWKENAIQTTPLFIIGRKTTEVLKEIKNVSFYDEVETNEAWFRLSDIYAEVQPGCSGGSVFSTDGTFKGIVLQIENKKVTCLKLSSLKNFIFDKSINHNLLVEKVPPPTRYMFLNKATSKYLSSNGATACQHDGGWGCQALYLEPVGNRYLIHCNENNCLVDNSRGRNGGAANFGTCNSADLNQQWLLQPTGGGFMMFQNVQTGLFVTVSHAGDGFYKNGTPMEMWYNLEGKGHGEPNSQKWQQISQ